MQDSLVAARVRHYGKLRDLAAVPALSLGSAAAGQRRCSRQAHEKSKIGARSMIKTIKQACQFNPVIRDYRMSQGIENLAELIDHAGDGREFFDRNYVTHGMEQLFREGLL